MLFQVSSRLDYSVAFPSTLILNIHAQKTTGQFVSNEQLTINPQTNWEEFQADNSPARFIRLETGNAATLSISYSATVDCTGEIVPAGEIDPVTVAEMDRHAIPYLFPSRYCQSDRLGRLAWDLFGQIANPHEKVTAISNWIFENVEYVAGTTNSATSAYDTVTQRTGVCRDFAHLGIALCRALNIPSRYFSGYAYQLQPPDFHACFESYIGGRWMVFDATRLAPLNGLVRIGTGRDAGDAAVASIFGRVQLKSMHVDCQLAPGQNFQPVGPQQLTDQAVSLENSHVAPAN